MGSNLPSSSSGKAAELKPVFEVSKLADVNFGYLPIKDEKLMFEIPRDKCPLRYFLHEGGHGFIFSVFNSGDVKSDCKCIHEEVSAAGFSGTMSAILCEARRQRIHYVRFDMDGAEIQNAERAQ
jgi:hypothetical protein